ncbi:MAG: beta-ketoacyl-ACP reductase [Gammaproteobacteria bacterium]|nr:beta-ketoacyl-ACP reductase [Gammaproteobacteria bacterium]
MSDSSKGKLALVTGGEGGIGTAICKRLVDDGYRVVTNFRSEDKDRNWHKSMEEEGYNIPAYHCDVTDYDECHETIEKIENDLGPIDIVVNNAGLTRDTTLRKMDPEQWDLVLRADLSSVFNVTRPIIPGMLERGFGRIINIASINGQKGQFGQVNYSAAKAGMHGFTKALAQEVARKGITVNTVSPGYIGTEMVLAVPEEHLSKIVAQIPVGRLGRPDEVAGAVAYLASEGAAFITGSDLSINGGQYMH